MKSADGYETAHRPEAPRASVRRPFRDQSASQRTLPSYSSALEKAAKIVSSSWPALHGGQYPAKISISVTPFSGKLRARLLCPTDRTPPASHARLFQRQATRVAPLPASGADSSYSMLQVSPLLSNSARAPRPLAVHASSCCWVLSAS